MDGSINKRIRQIRQTFCDDSNKKFALQLQKKENTVNNWVREGYSVGRGVISDILRSFPLVSDDWLIHGVGEMTTLDRPSTTHSPLAKLIPFYDAITVFGSRSAFITEEAQPAGMIEIGGVLNESESALRVYGNSMEPNYPSGCIVGLKLHLDKFIEPGSVYVLETKGNKYLKRLYYSPSSTAFRCVSDNYSQHTAGPMAGEFRYPDFEVPYSEVTKLHRVVGVIKRNTI